jgi:hypothetical protein
MDVVKQVGFLHQITFWDIPDEIILKILLLLKDYQFKVAGLEKSWHERVVKIVRDYQMVEVRSALVFISRVLGKEVVFDGKNFGEATTLSAIEDAVYEVFNPVCDQWAAMDALSYESEKDSERPIYVIEALAVSKARNQYINAKFMDVWQITGYMIQDCSSGVLASRQAQIWRSMGFDGTIISAEKYNWKMAFNLKKGMGRAYQKHQFIRPLAKWGDYRTAARLNGEYDAEICTIATRRGDFSFLEEAISTPNYFKNHVFKDNDIFMFGEIAYFTGHYEGVIRVLAPLIKNDEQRENLIANCLSQFYSHDPYDFERAIKIATLVNLGGYKNLLSQFVNNIAFSARIVKRMDIVERILVFK